MYNKVINIIEEEFKYQINKLKKNEEKIKKIKKEIRECSGNIYICGVGKSGNMGKNLSDILKSVSIKSNFISPLNMLHGDIGLLKKNDIIIFLSKSGNTKEIINLIPFIHKKEILTIGICCEKNSLFEKECRMNIILPLNKEIGVEKKIPTNSNMIFLIFSNILVSLFSNEISLEEYKNNHPSGNIGKNLKKIKEILIKEYPTIKMKNKITVTEVLLEMTKYKIGCMFFIKKNRELIGILTDGDIRRLLLKNPEMKIINENDINKNYYYEEDLEKYTNNCKMVEGFIPIIKEKKMYGIIRLY